jgi:DNA-binding transcriptional LysR family regulator
MSLSLRQLQYFVAAAEAGTIAGGASISHVSQSAVALAISELEKTLDVQLVLRAKAKGLTLTAAGVAVLADARSLLGHADDLVASARSLGQELSGPLSVGCYTTMAPFLMPTALEEFAAEHPTVTLTFAEGSQAGLQARLIDGSIELAVLYDLDIEPGIDYEVLYQTRPYVLLAADHPLATGAPVRLRDLADEPMIMLDQPPSQQNFTQLLASAGVKPRVRQATSSFEAVRSLVARNLGYALLVQRPTSLTSYEGLPITHCDIAEPMPDMPVLIAWRSGAKLTRRAQAFSEFCHRVFPDRFSVPVAATSRKGGKDAHGRRS